MKIRSDFVTNSSSSSFIVVLGKISSIKAKSIILEEDLSKYIIQGKDVKDLCYELEADWAGVFLQIPEEIEDNGEYIYFEGCYGDDCDFVDDDDEYGELNYDIGLDFFPKNVQKIYNIVDESNGFKDIRKDYGAGRNG